MSRTRYSFYNFIVSTIAAILLPLIGFIKFRLFVDFYGSDINGLQLTIAQVVTFLNICELAYSLAFRQLLFKPLAEDDHDGVLNIYHGACRIFRITGWIVIGLSLVLALGFPFFADSPLDYWKTVGTFFLLALPHGLSYFLMGPNFVIMADQKEYRINIWIQSISILRMVLMVIAIILKLPFIAILLIEAANILCANYMARSIALKAYPWLKNQASNPNDSSFKKKAWYAMIQRLSELATTQTDNIVISGFMGYAMSSVYGTYSYLTDNIGKITQTMVQSPMNSFGNLFNDEHGNRYAVFLEFFNFSTYISTIVATAIFIVLPQFVPIWMRHPLYEVSIPVCICLGLNIFYMTLRQPVIIARDTNGLYVNAKNNAYLLAIVKVLLSIILVKPLGLFGVALATTLSYWTIDLFYNPNLVYQNVFHRNTSEYFVLVGVRLLIALGIALGGYLLWQSVFAPRCVGVFSLIVNILIIGIILLIVTTIIYWVCFPSFRSLYHRLMSLFQQRHKEVK